MSTPHLEFDHLAITCHKLSAGVEYIRRVFGVEIPLGGQHEFMGTHNAVMAVGDGIYLEVIAIDPSLKVPPYPRWFGLGNPRLEDEMKTQPILMHYVLRTPDMAATLAGLDAGLRDKIGPVNQGARGDLRWQITINPTGLPPEG
ncbi:MAG: VOC family protein, partial [Candidatus Micropelagos thuwalensis]